MSRKLVRLTRFIRDIEDQGDDPDAIYIDPEDTLEIEESDDEDIDEA